jgi:hypothetical protein
VVALGPGIARIRAETHRSDRDIAGHLTGLSVAGFTLQVFEHVFDTPD